MGLGVDPDDNVSVATDGNRVVRITPNGGSASVCSTMSTISGGNGGVQFLALTPPAIGPEPATCGLALGALACSGYSAWRRRRRPA